MLPTGPHYTLTHVMQFRDLFNKVSWEDEMVFKREGEKMANFDNWISCVDIYVLL